MLLTLLLFVIGGLIFGFVCWLLSEEEIDKDRKAERANKRSK
jgi:hypothetical protein